MHVQVRIFLLFAIAGCGSDSWVEHIDVYKRQVQGATAQINYGTTGLMNLPTADMQRDKTFMVGGNWLNQDRKSVV